MPKKEEKELRGAVRSREEAGISEEGSPEGKQKPPSEGDLSGAVIALAADVIAEKNNISVKPSEKQEIAEIIGDLPDHPSAAPLAKACSEIMKSVNTDTPKPITESDVKSTMKNAVLNKNSISNKSLSRAAVDKIRDTLSDSATRTKLIAAIMGLIGTFGPGAVPVAGLSDAFFTATDTIAKAGSISNAIGNVVKFVRTFWSN